MNFRGLYIKGLNNAAPPKLSVIFKKIEGFSFATENGYINWNYKSLDKGTIPYVIGSLDFESWVDQIYNVVSIKTFEELEPFLTS